MGCWCWVHCRSVLVRMAKEGHHDDHHPRGLPYPLGGRRKERKRMLKNQDGEKTTPNKAAKAAIVEALARILDTVPEGILEDTGCYPEWRATAREEEAFYKQLRKRCNGVLSYLGMGVYYPEPEESQ